MTWISNSKFQQSASSSTGDFDSLAAGTVTAMAAVSNTRIRPGTLSATMVLDAETNTLTLSAGWEVSDSPDSGFKTLALAPNNPAAVVIATGTGGADAAVTVVIPAPAAASGHRFVRATVTNGVATGTTSDTYTVSYNHLAS